MGNTHLNFLQKTGYGFIMSLSCFTVIPSPTTIWKEEARNQMLTMLKYVGILIGGIEVGLYFIMMKMGVSTILMAGILTAYPFVITGFIHLDGFMDCVDAVMSRRSAEEKKRILKDSHVGAFAVIGCVLLMMLYFASMVTILQSKHVTYAIYLIAVNYFCTRMCVASLLLQEDVMAGSQYADSSKDKDAYKLSLINFIVGSIIATSAVVLFNIEFDINPFMALVYIAVITQAAMIIAKGAGKKLGGVNGDVAGYTIVYTELVMVILLALF